MLKCAQVLAVIIVVIAFWVAKPAQAVDLIYFDTPDSITLFEESKHKSDFWPVVQQFVSEYHLTYCGIASSVIVLNALGIEPPLSQHIHPYAAFDQVNYFTKAVVEIKPPQDILTEGLSLDEVAEMLRVHGVKVDIHRADEVTVDQFRDLVVKAIDDPDQMAVVNYERDALGQPGPGHISPVVAYHEATDRFLMMDVARYKLPPVWVKSDDFLAAMNTIDPGSNASRGFFIVTKP